MIRRVIKRTQRRDNVVMTRRCVGTAAVRLKGERVRKAGDRRDTRKERRGGVTR